MTILTDVTIFTDYAPRSVVEENAAAGEDTDQPRLC